MATYEAQASSVTNAEHLPSWTFDPARTEASFLARRMGRIWANGRFRDVRGKFFLDLDEPRTSRCFGEIDVTQLYAGAPYLNTQLRAADFLGVEEHRKITFDARLAHGASDNGFTAEVLLTLRGTTRLVVMDVAYLGQWKAPFWLDGENRGTATRMGLRAEGRITRQDFGIVTEEKLGNGEMPAANAIEIALDIEASLDADLEAMGAIGGS
jgi:polyisoprenoid-binding protein YceI